MKSLMCGHGPWVWLAVNNARSCTIFMAFEDVLVFASALYIGHHVGLTLHSATVTVTSCEGAVYRMTCCLSGTHAMTLFVEIIHCMCGLGPVFGVAECAVLTIFFPCWQGNRHSIAKFGVVYL